MYSPYQHLECKARAAKRGGHDVWATLSTGERVAVALVLNRADWLEEMNYTIAQAIGRSGPEWREIIPHVAEELAAEE